VTPPDAFIDSEIIRVEHLVYEYPGLRALDDVSFSLPENTITALVGPNGAGKTTLLRCLAALTRPFSGSVFVGGRNTAASPREVHKLVGYLPDFYGLYDRLTVRRTLQYFAMAQKVPKQRIPDRIQTVMKKLDLEEKANATLGSLSRGMRQRLAIGQAMVHDPKILLLDEPASGLDPEARDSLTELLLELMDEGKSILVSSHILAELDRYAGAMLILRDGRLVEAGRTAETGGAEQVLCIEHLGPDGPIVENLSGVGGVGRMESAEGCITFGFSGDATARAALLGKLVVSGARITAYFEKSEGVQEHYLKTIRKTGEDGDGMAQS
jgi:ABC-2 type transport system ATP-binding protein